VEVVELLGLRRSVVGNLSYGLCQKHNGKGARNTINWNYALAEEQGHNIYEQREVAFVVHFLPRCVVHIHVFSTRMKTLRKPS